MCVLINPNKAFKCTPIGQWRVQGSEGCRLRNVGSSWPLTCFRDNHMWPWLMEKSYRAVCNVAARVLKQHNKGMTPAVRSKRKSAKASLFHFYYCETGIMYSSGRTPDRAKHSFRFSPKCKKHLQLPLNGNIWQKPLHVCYWKKSAHVA